MAKDIEIGGRLHSTATGNVVAGANEVLDDTKNKKQNVINAEVDAAIGDDNTEGTIKGRIKAVENSVETLNGDSSTSGSVAKAVADAKTELIGGATSGGNTLKKVEDRTATLETAVGSNGSVDQRIAAAKSEVIGDAASDYNTLGKLEDKIQAEAQSRQDAITAETNRATTRENQIYDLVHTPEQHYVTVATYAELANIASPSDDTIYRVSSYNGKTSQVDNTVYSEYGYDGTNFVFLCVKSQIDEVYDISVHHSNNTYVDLAAALDGGNNIPQELRRGGMSVKFVQSSDNKYVQWRLMAQSFSTTVSDWQGIDNEPINASHNLVESGGAFDSEMLASQLIRENLELDGDITNVESYEVGLLQKDGTLANYDWFRTYTVANTRTDNRFIFVKAYHFGGLPDFYYTFALIRQSDNKVVAGGRLQGFQIIGVEWGYTLKISQDTNMGNIGVSWSISTREKGSAAIAELDNKIAINYNDIVQQFVRTGLELAGNIVNVSNYDIGVLRIDGTVDSGIDSWRTYTVVNNEPNNKVLFVEAYHTGNLPDNAYCTFCIYRKSDDKMVLQGRLENEQIIAINPNYYLKISQFTNFGVRYSDLTNAVGQIFERSTCVWLGTSIPEQGYPQIIRAKLRMGIVYNESQGSSMCRKGRVTKGDAFGDDLGLTGVAWQNVVLSLSMTQEEKLFLFKRWTTENRKALMISEDGYTAEQVANVIGYGNMLAGTFIGEDTEPSGLPADKPQDFMNPVYANARKLCYSVSWNNSVDIEPGFGTINGKIEKYLNSESFPDLWVFDHGHNDAFDPDINDFKTIPTDKFDRSYFIGAMNYIVSKIFSYNPKAKIIVVGHYTNQIGGTNNPPICTEGQVIFANYWQFPIIKTWELLPFSQAVITTTGYWDANHEWHDTGFDGTNHVGNNFSGINQNPRQINGVWVHDLTMKQVWMWDDIHPSSTEAKEIYAKALASEIFSMNCK